MENNSNNLEAKTQESLQVNTNISAEPNRDNSQEIQPEPTSFPKSEKKWLLPFLIITTLLALGTAIFFAFQNYQLKKGQDKQSQPESKIVSEVPSPTPDPTANWESYTNKSGYSIKFPAQYQAVAMKNFPEQDKTPIEEYPDIKIETTSGFNDPHLRILTLSETYVETEDLSLLDAAKKHYQANLDLQAIPAISIQEPVADTFAGNAAASFVIQNKGFEGLSDSYLGYEGNYKVIWVENGDKRYLIYWTQTPEFNQIISTFEFLNQKNTSNKKRVCPTNWWEFLSPIQVMNNPYFGQTGQFITTEESSELAPVDNFDLEWIKENCEVREPEPVG